jgi:uncharacterized protein
MFRRRHKTTLTRKVREFIWPSLGWRRSMVYLGHRMGRLPGSPYSIAAGFACGTAIAFTPFLGFHFLIAAVLAWAIGGNLIASAIGTAMGNPWTYPFMWLATYRIGTTILGRAGHTLPAHLSLTYVRDHPFQIMLPMSLGSIPIGIVAWALAFVAARYAVIAYQNARARRRHARRTARPRLGLDQKEIER